MLCQLDRDGITASSCLLAPVVDIAALVDGVGPSTEQWDDAAVVALTERVMMAVRMAVRRRGGREDAFPLPKAGPLV